jgi:RND family efflux transporter MFP subunit
LNLAKAIDTSELTQKKTVDQLQDALASAQSAYNLAMTNATTQVAAAVAVASIQKAAYDAAQATLALKKAPPRQADIASLQAAVEQARVAADKANADLLKSQIIAPVDGTISDIIPTIGEQVVPNTVAIKMVGTSGYEVEAQVPEADVAKVVVGQTATMTLDAYGDDVVFQGSVVAEEPDQTKIQEAIYYNVRIQIDPSGKDIKPGMTANVTIRTEEAKNVLVIPLRAVRTKADTGEKTVRVLVTEVPEERTVELGLRGDEGRVEVISGVKVDEKVVTGESTPGAPTP